MRVGVCEAYSWACTNKGNGKKVLKIHRAVAKVSGFKLITGGFMSVTQIVT